jgi:hypothetical protein
MRAIYGDRLQAVMGESGKGLATAHYASAASCSRQL